MGTTFRLSGVALSSFRMCHINLRFLNLRFTIYLRFLEIYEFTNNRQYQYREPMMHIGDLGGEVPFAYCIHLLGDYARSEY